MARLPQPGGDNGNWGTILNDFLSQALKSNGTIKDNAVTANTIAPNSVTNAAIATDAVNAASIADGSITNALLADAAVQEAKLSSAVQAKLNAGTSTPDWSAITNKPAVIGAGATQAAARTTIGAGTASTKADVGLSDVDNTSDATKNSATVTLTNKTLVDPKINKVYDANGNIILNLNPVASAVNYVQIENRPGSPVIRPAGSNPDLDLIFIPKGTGSTKIYVGTGLTPTIRADGADTDHNLNLIPKGSGVVQAGGVPVVTTTSAQTLTNKTFTNPDIGTATGSASLNVLKSGDTMSGALLISTSTDNTAGSQLTVNNDNTGGRGDLLFTEGGAIKGVLQYRGTTNPTFPNTFRFISNTGTNADFVLGVNGSASSFFISGGQNGLTNGYIGVGTNTPAVKLDVAGEIRASTAGASSTSVVTVGGTQTLTNKTLTSPRINQIFDTNGANLVGFGATTSAVNFVGIANAATGATPNISASGSDTNISLALTPKGNGTVRVNVTTGQTPTLAAQGADTNHNLNLLPKGTGIVTVSGVEVTTITGTQTLTNKTVTQPRIDFIKDSNGAASVVFTPTASAVNYLAIQNRATGSSPVLASSGADTNLDLVLQPKGSGSTKIYVATGQTPTVQGDGQDANHNLNLLSKGTGVVQANGVEVMTVSGAQTLSNKTLSSPQITGNAAVATAGTFNVYNTADQTTNYERIVTEFASNSARIYTAFGGTAASRTLNLGVTGTAGSATLASYITISSGAPFIRFNRSSQTTAAAFVDLGSITATSTSAVATIFAVNPIINQSSTAGYTALVVNPTETATGSGTKLLADFQVGGASKTRIDSTGTHTLSNGASMYLHNVADETTNYERTLIGWSSNTFKIITDAAGTGTFRTLQIGAGGGTMSFTTGGLLYAKGNTSNTNIVSVTATYVGTSGTQSHLSLTPTITQTSTAGYTALLVNPTETTTGSGAKLLADFQLGGTSKTRIDNTGTHILSSGASYTSYNTTDETTNYERVRQYWSSNVMNIRTENGGTGVGRNLQLGTPNRAMLIADTPVAAGIFQFGIATSVSNATGVGVNGNLTQSSGTIYGLAIQPTVIQTSTAGYTALLINPTETSLGSGTKLLADFQVGGTSKVSITNLGQLKLAASTTSAATMNIPTGTAPSSPSTGDVYSDGTHVYCYLASTWKQLD